MTDPKHAQALVYLALRTPTRALDRRTAIELLHLADRESLKRWAAPILDDEGPAADHPPATPMIEVPPRVAAEDLDELSDADIGCLDAAWARRRDRPRLGGEAHPPLARRMRELAVPDAGRHLELLEDHRRIDELFASLR